MTTETTEVIGLEIPEKFYRALKNLRWCADNKRTMRGGPITKDYVYLNYRTCMERLVTWLLDEVIRKGYGTERRGQAFKVIGHKGDQVILGLTDNPFGIFWTDIIIGKLSDEFGFGGLLDVWRDDP